MFPPTKPHQPQIGGVPEHFNYPLHLVKKLNLDHKNGVNLIFEEQKCGTGQMIANLKAKSVDLIVALTEGITADIAKGNSDVRILGTYVDSPLCWAISGCGKNDTETATPTDVAGLRGQTFGISRYGSGSQLMAYVLALERGWNPQQDISFQVIGNFQKLRDSVNTNTTQAFMWETFTTKPYHDSGEVSRLGDISTPWPCFMVAGLQDVVSTKLEAIRAALSSIHEAANVFHSRKEDMPKEIALNYGLKLTDAETWYSTVKIAAHRHVSAAALNRALEVLVEAGVLPTDCETKPEDLIHSEVAELMVSDIKQVRLYRSSANLIRLLHSGLNALGLSNSHTSLSTTQLAPLDQIHHYGSVAAIDECLRRCGMKDDAKVINIGSGLGGPARHIAQTLPKSTCLAIELQHDLHSTAQVLTERCSLSDRVTHMAVRFIVFKKSRNVFLFSANFSFADRLCVQLLL